MVEPSGEPFDPKAAAKEASGGGTEAEPSKPGLLPSGKFQQALMAEDPHTEPVEEVDAPTLEKVKEHWIKYGWRGLEKVSGVASRSALADFIKFGVGGVINLFSPKAGSEDSEESESEEEITVPEEELKNA